MKSPDVKALKDTRKKKGNAFHDVAAYLFVREQRGAVISSFQKGKYWFVTTNYDLLLFNKEHASVKGVTEIVLPDVLTSMLWLKDPAKLTSQVRKIGLRELMATTLNEEIASKELIENLKLQFHRWIVYLTKIIAFFWNQLLVNQLKKLHISMNWLYKIRI